MENKNILIGLLAAIIIIGGGIWLFSSPNGSSPTASSTPTGTDTSGDTGTNPGTSTAAAPAVTTGTLVVVSNSSAVVTGKVTPNGAQTTYWYEYGRTSSLGSRTPAQALGSGYVSISAPAFISGLAANTSYQYRLVAANSLGSVNGTILSFTTNNNPAPSGSIPSVRTDSASNITRTSANFSGRINPDGASTSYWFEYGTTNNLGNTTSFQDAGNGTAGLEGTISVNGLNPATKYYYRVNAQNEFGTVTGAITSFTTNGPASVSAPSANTTSASNVTGTTATLNGQVNPNGAATTYWFEYGNDSLLGTLLGSTTHESVLGTGTSQVGVASDITNLSRGTTYWYRVVAQNSQGTTRGDIQSFKTVGVSQ